MLKLFHVCLKFFILVCGGRWRCTRPGPLPSLAADPSVRKGQLPSCRQCGPQTSLGGAGGAPQGGLSSRSLLARPRPCPCRGTASNRVQWREVRPLLPRVPHRLAQPSKGLPHGSMSSFVQSCLYHLMHSLEKFFFKKPNCNVM